MLAATTGDAAPAGAPVRNARIVDRAPPRPLGLPAPPIALAPSRISWAVSLPAIEVKNRNTNARERIRLYADDGGIDRAALRAFMRVASSSPNLPDGANGEVAEPLDSRLVQLAFRSAYHFGATSMTLVSATRKGSHGKHGSGDALDYQLDGVRASTLAAHVRTYPRAGVGIYTHPKTQYVHVDVRDRSYHWMDGSPPGVTWRERLLGDPTQQKRDAAYVKVMDLPEAAATGP
jgi:uncharacterized protein YcbK (DUF882 family)